MPFPQDVRARVFVRSARVCCLCFKLCGTNIQAAHIVAEADGGSNDEDNAIPLCLDCHQEVGAYDPRHPIGNKFTVVELKARRDQLYDLVESGALQAQIVAERIHARSPDKLRLQRADALVSELVTESRGPSPEAEALLEEAKSAWGSVEALGAKLTLLSDRDRAYVVDELINSFNDDRAASGLSAIIAGEYLSDEAATAALERLMRWVTLVGSAGAKASFMKLAASRPLASINEALQVAFFRDVIDIMLRDQYSEVNLVTPAVVQIQEAIPQSLETAYVEALLEQAQSSAYEGAPAARRGLTNLPSRLASAGLKLLGSGTMLRWHNEHTRRFVREHEAQWPPEKAAILSDFADLEEAEFVGKYWKEDV